MAEKINRQQNNRYQCDVRVEVTFLPEHSNIAQNSYGFAYHVTITNTGNVPAQLISRHWIISDGNAEQHEVKGLGVIGEQPVILPNGHFSYTSSTVINLPIGTMHGTYQMVADDGTQFDAIIHPFTLSMPRVLH